MAKSSTTYQCTDCGYQSAKWLGRCPQCHEWGTLEEGNATSANARTKVVAAGIAKRVPSIRDIDPQTATAWPTGVGELDRVLGGGFVPGAVVLLAGEPGVGKSTLLLDVAARAARAKSKVLYVTGEESAGQVRLRAGRIDALEDNLLLAAETDLGTVLGMVEAESPDLLIVDSVQTLASAEVDGVPGGVTQVREVAAAVIGTAKSRGVPTVLVGHITKDGNVAGPRLLEHLVDVVCSFEGERHSRLRMLRALKNRYGPTDEVGCFDMTESGIVGLEDPSGLFLSRQTTAAPGSCLTVTLEGRRPLVVEIQSLIAKADSHPRRTVSGVDSSRVAMNLAVLSKALAGTGISTAGSDVFVATVGGAKVVEPSADLAVCLALASAAVDRRVYQRLVGIGEISLSGEIRRVPGIERRLNEAARLGIRHAVVATGTLEGITVPTGMKVRECATLVDAIDTVFPAEKRAR